MGNTNKISSIGLRSIRLIYLISSFMFNLAAAGNEIWPVERPSGMPTINSLEVMCGKDHMDVHLSFSAPFDGIVSSKGQHSDPRCIYVPPSTGKTFFAFRIAYARCGTKPDLNGQFYENTVVVQYDKDLLEVWDEAKRLRCEWFNDYEKTASKPPMVIADLDVIQLDFRGDNVDCWMEIQHGKGPWAPPVSGIVPLGSTLTLVVAINDYRGEFDMRVKSCVASDDGGHVIKLSDEYGCVLRPKMISHFLKARAPDEKATVLTYAFFHAFKFPDALSVHIKCKVEICRHGCLDHCQTSGSNERKDVIADEHIDTHAYRTQEIDRNIMDEISDHFDEENEESYYEDDSRNDDALAAMLRLNKNVNSNNRSVPSVVREQPNGPALNLMPHAQQQQHNQQQQPQQLQQQNIPMSERPTPPPTSMEIEPERATEEQIQPTQKVAPVHEESIEELMPNDLPMHEMLRKTYLELKKPLDEKFPHGPRTLAKDRMGMPPVAGPRSLNIGEEVRNSKNRSVRIAGRTKRSVVVSDRKVRSADVGVSSLYEVISQQDLEFSPDSKQEAVTVFQGQIYDEIVYGICMPIPGFSILFIIVVSATIVSALVAGSLLYRYQIQKTTFHEQQKTAADITQNSLASWMMLRLFHINQSHANESAMQK